MTIHKIMTTFGAFSIISSKAIPVGTVVMFGKSLQGSIVCEATGQNKRTLKASFRFLQSDWNTFMDGIIALRTTQDLSPTSTDPGMSDGLTDGMKNKMDRSVNMDPD